MLISELLQQLETYAPFALAMDWDNVGLLIGDPGREAMRALITLDVTPNAVQKAVAMGADLILSHHPLIFRPLSKITDPLLLALLENRIAVICLHTNLDVAPQGVNHALAAALGLEATEILSAEQGGKWYHLSVAAPVSHSEAIAAAAGDAGAGRIGNYARCFSQHEVTGAWTPLPGARPYIGSRESSATQTEIELEFMVDEAVLPAVLQAVKSSHPYETPLLYYFPVSNANPAYGLGLVGRFPESLNLLQIVELVRARLHCPRPRLWTAGRDPQSRAQRIAVCGGAGSSILKQAARSADLVITGDIGYHHLLESAIPIIDAGHFYTEYPALEYMHRLLVECGVSCEVLPMQEHEYSRNLLEQGWER